MKTETSYDFSMNSVPDSWHEAADEAPAPDPKPLYKKKSLAVMPIGDKVDLTTAFIASVVMSVLTGVTWYLFETRRVTDSPWLALAVGVFIALAVRLGGTAAEPDIRATVSAVFYLATVLTTVYMIERHDFRLLYTVSPGLKESESALVRDRLTEPTVIFAWVLGLVTTMQLSYWTGRRRR